MGRGAAVSLYDAQQRALANDVIALYEADYAKAWDDLLQDINVVPLRSLPQSAQDLYILASPQSPMKALLTAIARQLALSEPPKSIEAKVESAAEAAVKSKAAAALPSTTASTLIPSLLTGQPGAAAPALPPGQAAHSGRLE